MTSVPQPARDRDDWMIPTVMTVALGVCLLAFLPFAGPSVEDDRFWLTAFDGIWLATAAALVIREGPAMSSRPKSVAYHAASFAAFVPHLLVGSIATARISLVVRAFVIDPGRAVQEPGVFLVAGLFATWLGVTAWGLYSWVRRSWATLLLPVISVVGLVASAVMLFAIFGPGQH